MGNTTLVIMAAGMGSRYGGIKQLEPVGPSGEIIMDYSIYDAIKAGFDKVVFIIRRDLEKDFKEVIGNRIGKQIKVEYVFQELDALPERFTKPTERTRPWGTGQAVLCCKDVVKEPFAVINADDYYGQEGFRKIYEFLNQDTKEDTLYCMAGFILGNTLSDNGAVTRGVCQVDDNGMLADIVETSGIVAAGDHAVAKNSIGEEISIHLDNAVSMNMWGFQTSLFTELEKRFTEFLSDLGSDELKKEYLLPEVVGNLIEENKVQVKVLKTSDRWFGVTYKEDKAVVMESIRALVQQGIYPDKLFS